MTIVTTILFAAFVGLIAYAIGLRRGTKIGTEQAHEDYKNAYWEGYCDGRYDPRENVMDEWYNQGFEDGKACGLKIRTKNEKADEMLAMLDDLFGENKVIDCGDY